MVVKDATPPAKITTDKKDEKDKDEVVAVEETPLGMLYFVFVRMYSL